MTHWYVKELSDLTKVSPQTLHHYDRIGLLKPSVRLNNGYRMYSEEDFLRLKKIIALKYFKFKLSQIKNLLENDTNILDHLLVQAQILEKKAKVLAEASEWLEKIISEWKHDRSVFWTSMIEASENFGKKSQTLFDDK
ncbi:MerR family transcriptional regulator [Candidatus Finniella inopinata]|uniref:MerR family transcriptional regulator n=1 Tax=Candidatus Finniella inopinata TaxID=1696036 RepID=A0A4V2DZZ1_9PROT|nr:MerR family transcriptional regulator [Candidatus Finniella inopinata]RZI46737.1 MerR family transcriptional regulator [Candidatus Finniella inopinata]